MKSQDSLAKRMWTFLKKVGAFLKKSLSTAHRVFITSFWLAFYGGLVFLVVQIVNIKKRHSTKQEPGKEYVLQWALSTSMSEINTGIQGRSSFVKKLHGLRIAREDPNIKGLILCIDRLAMGLAQVQELHKELIEFGKKKPVYALFMAEGSTQTYALASAAQKIYLHPEVFLNLKGFFAERFYWKKLLEKIGVSFAYAAREEYKSGIESLTLEKMSSHARENMQSLFKGFGENIVSIVEAGRPQLKGKVDDLIARGPYLGHQACAHGLVDDVAPLLLVYSDIQTALGRKDEPAPLYSFDLYVANEKDVATRVHRRKKSAESPKTPKAPEASKSTSGQGAQGEEPSSQEAAKGDREEKVSKSLIQGAYHNPKDKAQAKLEAIKSEEADPKVLKDKGQGDSDKKSPKSKEDGKKGAKKKEKPLGIAVVTLEGEIYKGNMEGPPPLFERESEGIEAYRASDMLTAIGSDPSIGAVVLRINSPGGDAVASEIVRSALMFVKGRGKKVVVSMGNMAASGGYWIASAGDYIFANPGTVTGSIGVYVQILKLDPQFIKKLGVGYSSVETEKNASLLESRVARPKDERKLLDAWTDYSYLRFLSLVHQSRNMDIKSAREVAKGRVWTGKQALEKKLVDGLGGVMDAIQKARELAEIPEDKVSVFLCPREKSTWGIIKAILFNDPGPIAFDPMASLIVYGKKALLQSLEEASQESRQLKLQAPPISTVG